MIRDIDPITWYGQREVDFTPVHFTVTNTPLTMESKLWILQNLSGRFSVISKHDTDNILYSTMALQILDGVPAFEDPKEATMYELKWS
jgi:hypothetical protein